MLQRHLEPLCLLVHPRYILVDIGSIDDDEKVVFTHLIDEQVVNDTTVFVTHHAVENFSVGYILDIVGEDVVDIALSIRPRNEHFSHVRDIEYAAGISYGIVFVNDIRVLNGHIETSKRRHQCSQFNVFVIQTCFLCIHIGLMILNEVNKFFFQIVFFYFFDSMHIIIGQYPFART